MKKKINKLTGFFKFIYHKIFKSNDSPQRIALGLGLGALLGVLPGTGPVAAVFLATLLRINKAGALAGSLLVNSWINIAAFLFAIKIGCCLTGLNQQQIHKEALRLFADFHYNNLFTSATFKVIIVFMAGYFAIAVCIGLFIYLIALMLLKARGREF